MIRRLTSCQSGMRLYALERVYRKRLERSPLPANHTPLRYRIRMSGKQIADLSDIEPVEGQVVAFKGVAVVGQIHEHQRPLSVVREALLHPIELLVAESFDALDPSTAHMWEATG